MAVIGFEVFEFTDGGVENIGGVRIIDGQVAVDAPEWIADLAKQPIEQGDGSVLWPEPTERFLRALAFRVGGRTRPVRLVES